MSVHEHYIWFGFHLPDF